MNINASSLLDTIENSGYKYTKAYTKKVLEADDDVEAFQEKFEEFRKIIRRLNNYSSDDTTDEKLKGYLSDLADTYNSMSEKKENITDSNLKKYLDKLDTLIDDNAKSLKKLGLKKNDDGELEFDEDTFDDDYDQKIVNKLFTGTGSFIDQARKLMRNIDYSASDAQIVTTERHLSSVTKYSESEYIKAATYNNIHQSGYLMNKLYNAKINNKLQYSDFYDEIDKTLKILAKSVNDINDTEIKNKFIDIFKDSNYSENLSNIGITYDDVNEEIAYTKQTNFDTNAFEKLFIGDEGSFYSQISQLSKNKFTDIIDQDKLGVTINEYL
jgi:hypothetical protein